MPRVRLEIQVLGVEVFLVRHREDTRIGNVRLQVGRIEPHRDRVGLVTLQECIGLYGKVRGEGSVKGPVFTVRDIRRLVPRRVGTTRNLVRSYPRRTIDEDLDTRRVGVIEAGHESRIDRMVTCGWVLFVAVVFECSYG